MKTNRESQDRSWSPAASFWQPYPLPPWYDIDPEEAPERSQIDSDEKATHVIADAQATAAGPHAQRSSDAGPLSVPEQQAERKPQWSSDAGPLSVPGQQAERNPQRSSDAGPLSVPEQQPERNPQRSSDAGPLSVPEQQPEHNPQRSSDAEPLTVPEQQTHPSGLLRRRWSIVVGILTFVAVALLGSFVVSARPITYEAVVTLVVVPSKQVPVSQAAGLFDTLSRGQVVATAAELFQQERWHRDVPGVIVTAGSITPSAVIKVAASGPAQSQVVDVLSDIVRKATPEANRLLDPYQVVRLDTTTPQAEAIGLTRPMLYGMVVLASLFVAAFMYRVWPRAVKWTRRLR
jgi:hypothetical protein